MAKTKREFILATCFLAGAGAILSLVSLGTENWVEAEGSWMVDDLLGTNVIKYGLFQGIFRQTEPNAATFQITMTCLLDKNICALLCGIDAEARYLQLNNLYGNTNTSFDAQNCPRVTRRFYETNTFDVSNSRNNESLDKKFLNSGVWVATIFFLCISSIMGLMSCGIAVWNTAYNPVEVYLSIYGLFVYNILAFFTILIVLLLWGIMFATTLIHDVSIYYTLVGSIDTNNRGNLGYSYWINLASLFCYCANIFLLYFRQYLINKEPSVNVHIEDNVDSGLYLY